MQKEGKNAGNRYIRRRCDRLLNTFVENNGVKLGNESEADCLSEVEFLSNELSNDQRNDDPAQGIVSMAH